MYSNFIIYRCPFCKRKSGLMSLVKKGVYLPSKEEREKSKNTIFEYMGHEILICPCGKKHTWFTLEKITFRKRL